MKRQFEYILTMIILLSGMKVMAQADISTSTRWNNRMNDFFKLFLKHQDKIIRVTLWGVTDNQTWRNDWPIKGRRDYPLLFDRNYNPKPIVETIIKEATQQTPNPSR